MIVTFDESKPPGKFKDLVYKDKDSNEDDPNNMEDVIRQMGNLNLGSDISTNPLELKETEVELPLEISLIKDHPIDNVLGDLTKGVQTRAQVQNIVSNVAFISVIEPKSAKEALLDEDWISAMQEELNQFTHN